MGHECGTWTFYISTLLFDESWIAILLESGKNKPPAALCSSPKKASDCWGKPIMAKLTVSEFLIKLCQWLLENQI